MQLKNFKYFNLSHTAALQWQKPGVRIYDTVWQDASAQTPVQMGHTLQTAEVCLWCRCSWNTSWYKAVASLHLTMYLGKVGFHSCTTSLSWSVFFSFWSLGLQLMSVDPSRETPCTGLIDITMAVCVWGGAGGLLMQPNRFYTNAAYCFHVRNS